MKFIDLFCGCGGFSEGMRQAGHECVLGVDNWEVALKSHEANHPEAEHWNTDILTIKPEDLPKADILIGSPPCPDYSVLGKKRGRDVDTALLYKFLELGKGYDVWIGENVPLIKKYIGGVHSAMLHAYDFGLWHKRKRCFFGNFKRPKPFTKNPARFPTPCANAGGNNLYRQKTLTKRKETQSAMSYPPAVAKWIMGFPDDYKILGTKTEQRQQIGNAVCPPVAKAIGETLRKCRKV